MAKKTAKKVPKSISIQPPERPNGQLPYPYHIDAGAQVGRQEFWKGAPLQLICFARRGKQVSSLTFEEFWKTPKKCIGLYPVFEHRNGEWYTYEEPVESISFNY